MLYRAPDISKFSVLKDEEVVFGCKGCEGDDEVLGEGGEDIDVGF